jgi:hypothetical protein
MIASCCAGVASANGTPCARCALVQIGETRQHGLFHVRERAAERAVNEPDGAGFLRAGTAVIGRDDASGERPARAPLFRRQRGEWLLRACGFARTGGE